MQKNITEYIKDPNIILLGRAPCRCGSTDIRKAEIHRNKFCVGCGTCGLVAICETLEKAIEIWSRAEAANFVRIWPDPKTYWENHPIDIVDNLDEIDLEEQTNRCQTCLYRSIDIVDDWDEINREKKNDKCQTCLYRNAFIEQAKALRKAEMLVALDEKNKGA